MIETLNAMFPTVPPPLSWPVQPQQQLSIDPVTQVAVAAAAAAAALSRVVSIDPVASLSRDHVVVTSSNNTEHRAAHVTSCT